MCPLDIRRSHKLYICRNNLHLYCYSKYLFDCGMEKQAIYLQFTTAADRANYTHKAAPITRFLTFMPLLLSLEDGTEWESHGIQTDRQTNKENELLLWNDKSSTKITWPFTSKLSHNQQLFNLINALSCTLHTQLILLYTQTKLQMRNAGKWYTTLPTEGRSSVVFRNHPEIR